MGAVRYGIRQKIAAGRSPLGGFGGRSAPIFTYEVLIFNKCFIGGFIPAFDIIEQVSTFAYHGQ